MSSSRDEQSTSITRSNLPPDLKTIDLQVVEGPDIGLRQRFRQPLIRVGAAAGNDLVLTDRRVSRRHLELRMTLHGVVLRDLWSSNGTFINLRRVTEAYLGPETLCDLGGKSRLALHYTPVLTEQDHLGALVGASPRMRKLYSLIRMAAPSEATVLLRGESGSGKELVARNLHELSGRTGPWVVCDVSAKGPETIRDDLFGHKKGAFTGADRDREGAFRCAHEGTLFIDEIGELPLDLQALLLRALESREVTPLGTDRAVPVDVRVIAATHRDLWAMVQSGQFRADLFYRLWVVPIQLPALREISDDVPLIAERVLQRMSIPCCLSPEAMERLKGHHWPGNVRELRNVLERAAVLSSGPMIWPEHLDLLPPPTPPAGLVPQSPRSAVSNEPTLAEIERQVILNAWERHGHSVTKTARELAISESTLKRRLKAYKGKVLNVWERNGHNEESMSRELHSHSECSLRS